MWRRPINVMTSGVDPALLDSSSLPSQAELRGLTGGIGSGDILSGGCEAEGCKLVENLGVEFGDREDRSSRPWESSSSSGEDDRPARRAAACRTPGPRPTETRPSLGPSSSLQHRVKPLERPGHLGTGGIAGQAEAGDVQGLGVQAMEPAGGDVG